MGPWTLWNPLPLSVGANFDGGASTKPVRAGIRDVIRDFHGILIRFFWGQFTLLLQIKQGCGYAFGVYTACSTGHELNCGGK